MLGRVAVEQRAVVAADVDHEVAGLQAASSSAALRDVVQVLGHRPVDAAAVPVRLVEDRSGHRVADLDEPARVLVARHVAADELERNGALDGLTTPGLGESARDALLAEVEHRRQLGRPADPASRAGAQARRRQAHAVAQATCPRAPAPRGGRCSGAPRSRSAAPPRRAAPARIRRRRQAMRTRPVDELVDLRRAENRPRHPEQRRVRRVDLFRPVVGGEEEQARPA